MKGLILASGMGRRISEHFAETPKCLLPLLNDETILDRQLQSLQKSGITDVIISTGYMKDKISSFVADKYSHLNVTFVFNEKYATTNYIYSLYLCSEYIDSDLILMHGDMVFDSILLEKLASADFSCVLVRDGRPTDADEKDFKGNIIDGNVTEISIDLQGENAFPLAPVYKLRKDDATLWLAEISKFIESGEVSCYAENALNRIMDNIQLKALFYKDKLCGEVDTYGDLRKIKEQLKVSTNLMDKEI